MVVHDLLWLVLSLVSVAMFSSDTSPNAPLLPLSSVFEYTYLLFWNSFWTLCPVIAIGLFDRIVGSYTAFSVSGVELTKLCRRSCIDGTPRVVSLWTRRKMVWRKAIHDLHARWCCTSKSMVIVFVGEVNNDVRFSLLSSSSSSSTGISLLPPGMMASVSPSMNSPRRWPSLQPSLPICSTDSIREFGPLGCSLLSSSALCSSGHTPYVQAPFFNRRSDRSDLRPTGHLFPHFSWVVRHARLWQCSLFVPLPHLLVRYSYHVPARPPSEVPLHGVVLRLPP